MAGLTNYSKWDNLEDSDEENETVNQVNCVSVYILFIIVFVFLQFFYVESWRISKKPTVIFKIK